MARARLLKPGFFSNESLAELPAFGRLLFAGLWTLADKKGRLDDRPKRIKAELFPYDRVNVALLLDTLEAKGFITRYVIESAPFIQIVNFEKHQHPHSNEPESMIPQVNDHSLLITASSVNAQSKHRKGSVPSVSDGEVDKAVAESKTSTIVRSQPDIVRRAPAEAESVTKAEAEAVDAPAHPFAFAFAKKYQEQHAGRPPPSVQHAAALALEREFGADACIQVATDYDWQKHPNYLRPILEERRDGKSKPERANRARAPDVRELTAQERNVIERTYGIGERVVLE